MSSVVPQAMGLLGFAVSRLSGVVVGAEGLHRGLVSSRVIDDEEVLPSPPGGGRQGWAWEAHNLGMAEAPAVVLIRLPEQAG
jgi:hypothetical protein